MSTLCNASTSSNEPLSKKTKYESLEDFSEEEMSPFSGDSDTETDSTSEGETAANSEEPYTNSQDNGEKPTVSTETKWFDERPFKPKIQFTECDGLNHNPDCITPLSFFSMFFSVAFLEFLVLETNTYAHSVLSEFSVSSRRISEWKDTNVDEMRVFLGLLFLMGVIRVNRINDYWRKHPLFNLPFSKFMGRDRFLIILRCLHFDQERTSLDVLHKIRPLITYFNDTMSHLYNPSRELTIGESMILWRGNLRFKQFLVNKCYKYGIKLYLLAEPNGMIQKLHAYAKSVDKQLLGYKHSDVIVHKLLEGKEGKGYSVYMNNRYTSVALVEDLLLKEIYCTGLLRETRKGTPSAVTDAVLKKGELRYQYSKDSICCCKWKDKREILCISSEYGENIMATKNRRGKIIYKPELIVQYDKFFKGVERQDQMISYYPINHKSLRWYKKLGIHIMHVMLNNAYILYNKHTNVKKSLHDFQIEVIMGLLPDTQEIKVNRKINIHLPEPLPKDKNNKTMRKRCKYCMETTNKRNDTIFCCPHCPGTPGLCLVPCFREFHGYR